MSTTITAFFDSRADADAAKERLGSVHVDTDHVHVHDKSSAGYREGGYSTHHDRGFWNSIKNAFLPDKDRHAYEEGVRRGGAVLTADVDDDRIDEAVRVLEEANSVDIDERAGQWRSSGWDYPPDSATVDSGFGNLSGAGDERGSDYYGEATARSGEQNEVIPIVEEQLVVGKREVSRGGVHVRSYVTETPVHEQVRLRNERVNVERRAADQPVAAADADVFRERTVAMYATGEEAVVGKNARVVEEVVVSKTVDERVESGPGHVQWTHRTTEVDIERSLRIAEVVASASDVFGSREEALSFMRRPAIALDQMRPIDLLSTAQGIRTVEDHLERLRYGVYS